MHAKSGRFVTMVGNALLLIGFVALAGHWFLWHLNSPETNILMSIGSSCTAAIGMFGSLIGTVLSEYEKRLSALEEQSNK